VRTYIALLFQPSLKTDHSSVPNDRWQSKLYGNSTPGDQFDVTPAVKTNVAGKKSQSSAELQGDV
jgi:hypothetical protein